MTSKLFYDHYGEYIQGFMNDPCFKKVEGAPLLKVVCNPESE